MNADEFATWLDKHRAVLLQSPHPTMCVIKIVSVDDPTNGVMVQHRDLETAIHWARLAFEVPRESRELMTVLMTGTEPARC